MMFLLICFMLGTLIAKADSDGVSCQSQEVEIKRLRKQIALMKPEVETKFVNIQTYYPDYRKNILSGYIVRGQKGIESNFYNNNTQVSTKRRTGLGIMYQRNIDRNLFLGGAIDTNTNGSVNLGIGF